MKSARNRGTFAAAVGALLGLALALLLSPLLPWRAVPGQLPGLAAAMGFHPRGGVLRLALLAALPLLGGAAARAVFRPRFPAGLGGTGAREGPVRALPPARPSLVVPAVAAHALGSWTLLAGPLVKSGVAPFTLYAVLAAASLALAVILGGGRFESGAAYLGAAAAALPVALLGPRPDAWWFAAGVAAYALPILARLAALARPPVAGFCRTLVVAVLLPGSLTALAAAACMRTPREADVFEDGHALLPASEYFRGELPYRDILPGHGLVSDGVLAAAQMRVFGDDYTGLKRGEKVSGAFFWPAFYAVGLGATGSPGVGFLGMLLAFVFAPQYHYPRATLSLWVLALALYATRAKRPGAWLACGAALPVSLCVAVEFAFYDAGAVAVALWLARGRRREHLGRVLLGGLVSAAAIALALALLGVLGDFLRATFVFIPALLPVYAMGFPKLAPPRSAAALAASLADETALLYGFVALSVVLLGAFLPRAPRVGPRVRAFLPVGAWTFLAMLSVLERQHVGYGALAVPVGLLLAARWARDRRAWTSPRAWLPALGLAALALARRPRVLVVAVAASIASPSPPAGRVALTEPPRARGGRFLERDVALVSSTAAALRRAGLTDRDTWLDFVGEPGLYYLFDRDCPIRYYEVGFYETEEAQREVIAAVERNPRVRLALMGGPAIIDGVPSAVRAPLVAAFIRERFRPFYREGSVEWWLRKEEATPTSSGPGASASPRP